jgi:two-component sensor histidine kinase
MVVHELATNAAKYGALSTTAGRLEVAWSEDDEGGLEFVWTERGGPLVAPPTRTGFGARLVRALIEGELGGAANLAYAPEGFVARLAIARPDAQAPARIGRAL